MKRLIRKNLRKVATIIKKAEWVSLDQSQHDAIQVITDNMAMGTQIQIDYEGSGWRLIQPYGWNTSKDGNILLMCYKDTGEIRSYRYDRVNQILVEDSQLQNEPVINNDPNNMYEIEDYNMEDFEIPDLPNMDEIIEQTENEVGNELPFDDALDYLDNDFVNIDDNNEFNNDINQDNTDDIDNTNIDNVNEDHKYDNIDNEEDNRF